MLRHPMLAVGIALCSCQPPVAPSDGTSPSEKGDSSAIATVLTFEFDAELTASQTWPGSSALIEDQLLYTIGQLNGSRAVGRLDRVQLTQIQSTAENGTHRIRYHAVLPVAWGSKRNLPTHYDFVLPISVDQTAQKQFTAAHKYSCVDESAHDVTADSMWYYYRPDAAGCALQDSEVVRSTATVTVSPSNTDGKYPEYDKVWQDNALRVVAIFGKYEKKGTTASDAGISAYNQFVAAIKQELKSHGLTTAPGAVPLAPGVEQPDITFSASLGNGRTIVVNALLVDEISTAPESFDKRYAGLTANADLIAYNGHAGLGQNIRALARKGMWVSDQYLIMFSNGCDTFAYVDGYLAEERAKVNPQDPSGTKYLDFVVNAMPAFFHSDAGATMAMIRGLMRVDSPLTYQQIFNNIDSSQVVLVTGEEDNTFRPASPMGSGFVPLREKTAVADGEVANYATATAAAGKYVIKLTAASDGGDADLYVRIGAPPTDRSYACRPYLNGSNEECRVTLETANNIYVQVRGFAGGSSGYELTVDPLN